MNDKIEFIKQTIHKAKDDKLFGMFQSLIQKHKLDYSTNNNGIFLNLSLLEESVILDIYNLLKTSMSDVSYTTLDNPQVASKIKPIQEIQPCLVTDELVFDKFDIELLEVSK